jgi:uncharacterized membrane protein YfcA
LISDPFFYFCAIPAVLIFGLSKGGFGGGINVVSVPLIALSVSPPQAAGILLPILCVMDLLALRKFWGSWDKANLRIMIPASIVGIVLGTFLFSHLSEAYVRLLIGLLAVGFGLNHWRQGNSQTKTSVSRIKGSFWSVVAGFTSFGIHAGTPPLNVYLLPQKLSPAIYMGTSTLLFTVINYFKLIPYFWLGQLHVGNLSTSLALLPLAPIGVGMGYYLHHKISPILFYKLINIFLIVTGAKLTYDGLIGI